MEDLKQQYNYDRNISQTSEKVKQKTSKKKKKKKVVTSHSYGGGRSNRPLNFWK